MSSLTYPGVYIREFTPPTPIEGVSTSIAAFLGPFRDGPPMEPTKVVSWDDFKRRFGDGPADGFYSWYAVRSFFENGGAICYALRVSNATFGQLTLNDNAGNPAVVIRARRAGTLTPSVTAAVQQVSAVSGANAKLYRPTAAIQAGATATTIPLSSANVAQRFRGGDLVTWGTGNPAVEVLRVEGAVLRLVDPIPSGITIPTSGTLRLADLPAGTRSVRAQGVAALEPGSMVRLQQTGQTDQFRVVEEVRADPPPPSGQPQTWRITFRTPLPQWPLESNDTSIVSFEFDLTIRQGTSTFPYPGLAMDPAHRRYFASVVAADANSPVFAQPPDPPNANRPAATGTPPPAVPSGTPDNPAGLTATDYSNALNRLRAVEDASIVCVPDQTNATTQANVIAHCREVNRFAILDPPRGLPSFGANSVESYRSGVSAPGGYAALYYPWIQVMDSRGVSPIFIPPSGAVAGIYADTDERRGVHKAPAGTETVLNALGVERTMGNDEQGQLNLQGINVLRVFRAGARPVVWGARTTEPANRYWQYVNIRRLFTFLERSLERALQESLFKPNTPQLWKELARSATAFLTKAWRDGALFGDRPEDAFYVRIDEALNPPSERALGRLYIEIGIKPAYPAEFIVVRIGVWEGGSEVTES